MSGSTPNVLLDTTLLSNFSHVQRPDLLRLALGDAIATTPIVITELQNGRAQGLVPVCDWSWLPVLAPTDAEHQLAAQLGSRLDPGEAECLAVAQSRQCKLLSDDAAARRQAKQAGVAVSGTLGVLLLLHQQGKLTIMEADRLLATMVAQGYRCPVKSLAELLPH